MAAKKTGYVAGVAHRKYNAVNDDSYADRLRRQEEEMAGLGTGAAPGPIHAAVSEGMGAVKQHPWPATKAAWNVATGNASWENAKTAAQFYRGYTDGKKGT